MSVEIPEQQIIERVAFIPSLNPVNPPGSDLINDADAHIRLIKNCCLNNFPNLDAAIITDGKFWANFQKLIVIPVVAHPPTLPPAIDLSGWFTLTGDYAPAATFDNGTGLQSIPKNLVIQSDGKALPKEPEQPLGLVFYSMLTVAEMNVLYGANKYVRCDGASYPDSQMAKEMGISMVPNLITNEHFPRASVTNISAMVSDSTGKGGLSIAGIDVGHNHNDGAHTHTYSDTRTVINNGEYQPSEGHHGISYTQTGENTSSVIPAVPNEEYTHNHNPLEISSTDTETVPVHFFANCLIRIN
jgi:hypothetical protein